MFGIFDYKEKRELWDDVIMRNDFQNPESEQLDILIFKISDDIFSGVVLRLEPSYLIS